MDKITTSFREEIYQYVKENYGTTPEHLWFKFPGFAVLRRADTSKWFGIIMDLDYAKLGIKQEGYVDVLNVKVDDFAYRDVLLQQKGILKGYHMGHNWISILLNGAVAFEKICELIDLSYQSALKKRKTKN